MIKLFIRILCCTVLTLHANAELNRPLTLAHEGKSDYLVVADEEPLAQAAAKDLRYHLEKVTGAPFRMVTAKEAGKHPRQIVIGRVGEGKELLGESKLSPNEGRVVTKGETLFLLGGDGMGVPLAVYSFLEKEVGCLWLTAYGDSYLPHQPSLTIPVTDRKEREAFEFRELETSTYQLRDELEKFLFRHGVNRYSSYRGELEGANQLPYIGPKHHSFFYFIAPGPTHDNPDWAGLSKPTKANFFATHPEYFSLNQNGERVSHQQLCFSNSGLREELTRQVRELIKREGRSKGVISVSALDVPGRFCYCEGCTKLEERHGVAGGPLYDCLIELCNTLAPEYPDILISTLAYRKDQSEEAPRGIESMPSNLVVIFAPIDANFAQSLTHSSNRDTLVNLQQWGKILRHLWVWYYPNPYFSPNPPFGNLERLVDDFRTFRDVGVTGFFVEHTSGVPVGLDLAELKTYLILQALKNPDFDLNQSVNAFTSHYYGAAAEGIRQWMRELESIRKAHSFLMPWNPNASHFPEVPAERLVAWNDLFDELEAKVAHHPKALHHVKNARMSLDFSLLREWKRISAANQNLSINPDLVRQRLTNTFEEMTKARFYTNDRASDHWMKRYIKRDLPYLHRIASVDPKPIPEELAHCAPETIVRAFPTADSPYASYVEDPEGAFGIATKADWKETLGAGLYSSIGRIRLVTTTIAVDEIEPDRYKLYRLGSTRLTSNCYLWVTNQWSIQIPLDQFYNVGDPYQQWDVYVSLKVSGDGVAATSKVSCDQVILVASERGGLE